MSDILQNAESLCGMFALPLQDDGRPDAQLINLVPDLVAEIKRLREENESQKTDYILMNKRYEACIGGPCDDVKLLKEQLAKWQQIAIDQRVARSEDAGWAQTREEAAKDLGLQLSEDDGPDLTIAYMLGSQKANERLKVLQEYVKRLEEIISDFYECDATRRGCCRQVAVDQARAALDRIREGR